MSITFRKIWKGFWEPVLRLPVFQWVLALFMALSIWFVYFTSRLRIRNIEVFKQYRRKPAIFVFWHGRSMMLSPIVAMRGMRSYAVASRHKDGRMMAKLQKLFGLRTIYGSTSDGGISVLREGVRVLRKGGFSVCLSPDGPGGPSLRVQDGALYFAKMSGAPIIPVCFSASRARLQKRWDRYLVALPFGTITCNVGEPIFIDRRISDKDFNNARKNLENYMVRQMRDMDNEFGLVPAEQDMTARQFKDDMRAAKAAKKANKNRKSRLKK